MPLDASALCRPNGVLLSDATLTFRCSALMMPALTLLDRPSSLPIATTESPTCTLSLLASVAVASPDTPVALTTARSSDVSEATIVAGAVLPSVNVTVIVPPSPAALTTWLFVRMTPSERSTMPEPSSVSREPWTVNDTTTGSTALTTFAIVTVVALAIVVTGVAAVAVAVADRWSKVLTPAAPATPPAAASASAANAPTTNRPRRRRGRCGVFDGGAGAP